jgi:hypothetical protein
MEFTKVKIHLLIKGDIIGLGTSNQIIGEESYESSCPPWNDGYHAAIDSFKQKNNGIKNVRVFHVSTEHPHAPFFKADTRHLLS